MNSIPFPVKEKDMTLHIARVFGRDGVYTPQLAVDGQLEFVGSHSAAAREDIQTAAHVPKLDVALAVSARRTQEKPALEIQASDPHGMVLHGAAELWLAVTEMNLQTEVKAGEDSGETLKYAAVVRSLRKIADIARSLRIQGEYRAVFEPELEERKSGSRGSCSGEKFAQNHRCWRQPSSSLTHLNGIHSPS
jgi:hypothetical protein